MYLRINGALSMDEYSCMHYMLMLTITKTEVVIDCYCGMSPLVLIIYRRYSTYISGTNIPINTSICN